MNIAQAKEIPISIYLERQGIKPAKERQAGRKLWYHSPIRPDDSTPSFKVDTSKNLWFDHGRATGGNIIDLVCTLCACSVKDALDHLEHLQFSPARVEMKKDFAGEKEGAFILTGKAPLKHPALLQYLTKRGINHAIARQYLSQITFKSPQRGGNYFALGCPAGDGFEARSALFKGFIGTGKKITCHENPSATHLKVFEGFMDMLSYLTRFGADQSAALLVLNSTNLWRSALPYLQDTRFKTISLYLDNDSAGDAVTAEFLKLGAHVEDQRQHFAAYDDLNAWHL